MSEVSVILLHSLSVLTDVVSIDPHLVVVFERYVGLIASAAEGRHFSAGFIQRFPKHRCICFSIRLRWNPTEGPFI